MNTDPWTDSNGTTWYPAPADYVAYLYKEIIAAWKQVARLTRELNDLKAERGDP